MSRPLKSGVDYFPLDTVLDTKFDLIEAEYGLKGFAIVVKLFQKIYGEFGYYCEWTDEVALLFSRKVGEGCSVVSEIISAAIRRGIFDRDMYEKHKILTSQGIQKRYFSVVSRRTLVPVKNEYLLIDIAEIGINVNKNPENVCNNSEIVYKNSQSKVKKSKENKNKGNSSADADKHKHKYGEYKHVLLTDKEYERLKADYDNADEAIAYLDNHIETKGYKAKSHYLAIRNWVFDALREKAIKSAELAQRESRLASTGSKSDSEWNAFFNELERGDDNE